LGFEIREANNGEQAIKQFEQWQPHLIWMDIRMPVVNEYETPLKDAFGIVMEQFGQQLESFDYPLALKTLKSLSFAE